MKFGWSLANKWRLRDGVSDQEYIVEVNRALILKHNIECTGAAVITLLCFPVRCVMFTLGVIFTGMKQAFLAGCGVTMSEVTLPRSHDDVM